MGCKLDLKDVNGQSVDYKMFGRIFKKFDLRPAKGETIISSASERFEIKEVIVKDSIATDDVIWTYIIKKRHNRYQTRNQKHEQNCKRTSKG